MTQRYRTTCFADALVDYPGSLEDTPSWREEVVGFRLVHDDDDQVNQGGMWSSGHVVARSGIDSPDDHYTFLGFRLAVDWRHE